MKINGTKLYEGCGSASKIIGFLNEGKNIKLSDFLTSLEDNCGPFHPDHPDFFLYRQHGNYEVHEKFKALLLFLDLCTDEKRFILKKSEKLKLNAIRFLTQKLVYSMYQTYHFKQIPTPLWYSSLIKHFIDTCALLAGESNDETLTQSIVRFYAKFPGLTEMWKSFSSFNHDYKKNPFIEGDVLKISKISMYLSKLSDVIPFLMEIISSYAAEGLNTRKVLEKFSSYYKLINNLKDLPQIPDFLINGKTEKDEMFRLIRIREAAYFHSYSDATGYINAPFLRAFSKLADFNDDLKIKLANYSHKDSYENISVQKYKDGIWKVLRGDGQSPEVVSMVLEEIEYILIENKEKIDELKIEMIL